MTKVPDLKNQSNMGIARAAPFQPTFQGAADSKRNASEANKKGKRRLLTLVPEKILMSAIIKDGRTGKRNAENLAQNGQAGLAQSPTKTPAARRASGQKKPESKCPKEGNLQADKLPPKSPPNTRSRAGKKGLFPASVRNRGRKNVQTAPLASTSRGVAGRKRKAPEPNSDEEQATAQPHIKKPAPVRTTADTKRKAVEANGAEIQRVQVGLETLLTTPDFSGKNQRDSNANARGQQGEQKTVLSRFKDPYASRASAKSGDGSKAQDKVKQGANSTAMAGGATRTYPSVTSTQTTQHASRPSELFLVETGTTVKHTYGGPGRKKIRRPPTNDVPLDPPIDVFDDESSSRLDK
jgi:hypothetical protein